MARHRPSRRQQQKKKLKRKENELKKRISQSMSDSKLWGPTRNCKDLQRKLAGVQAKKKKT
ncbi:MAG: hypothetical protein UY41_C0019G0001 [Candidatus Moranbacteria bacterium GW2011_GWE1_49_15]|nr:MAG: hypothetical protein UX75_C0018G0011 [Candidatus Moranbacteria bacterium GW2011_GWE2_47_10]KKW06613.1 MAG: hypothetical protein UY41_C0019G0001 [Candidatus Moranbacteria bacterium GW2011_GWE1_49_15]HBP01049.1 hypothetical protein [Candidatus Moranbacteria bacterium]